MGAFRRKGNYSSEFDHIFSLFPVLGERRKQLGGTLSGGEQQMLAIGRALMAKPRILLMDEPSLGLAPKIIAAIFEIITQIRSEGVTILLVEQNANQALRIADRGYVLENGHVLYQDTAPALLGDDRIRRAYLGQ
jgi:branched-chain amino acid transport system ATP-binding protein